MSKTVETTREMKDSGIEWIGKIPTAWNIGKVKTAFIRKNSKAQQENPTVLRLGRSAIQVRNIENNEGQLAESYFNYNPVEVGDLLLNPMDLQSGANCNMSFISGVISPAYINLRAKDGFVARYYDYYFKTQYWSFAFFAHGKGVSFENRWTLNNETVQNYNIPIPPLHEQQAIANYLDEQVEKIDGLISAQKQAIEQWKTCKQSLITETVTKGLNSDAPMKDSGIEWVGEIPSDWETVFINQLFTQLKNKNTEMQETNLLSLSYGKIVRKNIETREGLLPENFNGYNIINAGDIVLRLTDLQNDQRSLRCGIAKERGIITSAYVTLRNIKPLVNNYYYYLIHAYDIMKVFYGMGSGVRQGLTFDGLKKMRLLVPSIENQQQIADYLDDKCAKIDQTIEQKQALIKQLEEYKQSLIYECVTGKRRVL